MFQTPRVRSALFTVATAFVLSPVAAFGQGAPVSASNQPDMPPVNDLPNPYRTIEGWAKMPSGRTWGATSAVGIDPDGESVWVAERCGANTCRVAQGSMELSNLPVIMKFDRNGDLVTAFGVGVAVFPHGFHVDRQGNIWLTDGQDNRPQAPAGQPQPEVTGKLVGHQVMKFSPSGELLLTLGEPGGSRDQGKFFWQPNAVFVAPNGDVFVSEGHASGQNANARILKFDSRGNFIKEWGTFGTGPGQLNQPHALAMDSQGRLFVGDRGNNRVVIYDQEGNLLDTWYQFSRPSGLFIDQNDILYVADSESQSVARQRTDWKRGIRIGSARDGSVTAFIPDPTENPPSTSSAEGVAVDRNGVVYGAEVGQRALKRYVRQ